MSLLRSKDGHLPLPNLRLLRQSPIGFRVSSEVGILLRYQYFARILQIRKMHNGIIQSALSVMISKPIIVGTLIIVKFIYDAVVLKIEKRGIR